MTPPGRGQAWTPWLSLVLGAIPLGAVVFAIGHGLYENAYRVFGIHPEDVGLSEGRVVAQAGGVVGILFAVLASYFFVGLIQFRVVQATRPFLVNAPRLRVRQVVMHAAVALVPMLAVVGIPLVLAEGDWPRFVIRIVLTALTVGGWTVAARPTTSRLGAFFTMFGITVLGGIAVGGLGWHSPARATGALFSIMFAFGVAIAWANLRPSWRRSRVTVTRAAVLAVLTVAAVATHGLLRYWLLGAWLPTALGWYVGAIFFSAPWTQTLDRVFPAWRAIAAFALAAVLTGAAVILVTDREDHAIRTAERIKAGQATRSDPFSAFPIDAVPARLVPRSGDALHLCSRHLVARLLGRNGDVAMVLLRPPEPGHSDQAFVLPLAQSDYAVVTGLATTVLCEPLPG